jgi:hypothetical protein
MLGGNTRPLITDGERNLGRVSTHGDVDARFLRPVLDRVVDQIRDGIPQYETIRAHDSRLRRINLQV